MNIIVNIAFIVFIHPIIFMVLAIIWFFGIGIFEVIFFWNENIQSYFINLRELYPLGKLLEIPYIIYISPSLLLVSFFIIFFFGGKSKGFRIRLKKDLTDIDGKY